MVEIADKGGGEWKCNGCGVEFTLVWVVIPYVSRIEYCPFCGGENEFVELTLDC